MSKADPKGKADLSRRELLRRAGFTVAGTGFVPASALPQQGQTHQHRRPAANQPSGPYQRKYFNEHEFKTLQVLSDWIIPPDEKSQGGVAGGTAEFIDVIASTDEELQVAFSGGVSWLDGWMREESGKSFVDASRDEQKQLLDRIAYRANDSSELGPGIRFFSLVRQWTVDAFYSSKEGIADLDYLGNTALEEYKADPEVVRQLLNRSPV